MENGWHISWNSSLQRNARISFSSTPRFGGEWSQQKPVDSRGYPLHTILSYFEAEAWIYVGRVFGHREAFSDGFGTGSLRRESV